MDELPWNHLVRLDDRVGLVTSWRTSSSRGEFHPEHIAHCQTDLWSS